MSREIFFPSQFGSSMVFFLRTRSLSSYEDLRRPVAILPSALSVSDLRSVPVGRPRFSGCCDLQIALLVPLRGPGAGGIPQSPELGDVLRLHFLRSEQNLG